MRSAAGRCHPEVRATPSTLDTAVYDTTPRRWRTATTLIIDEVSMVDAGLFDMLESLARLIRGNKRPFGGLQLVITGDFFQLPPVAKRGQVKKFAFQADKWDVVVPHKVRLTRVFRQTDIEFVTALNAVREAACTEEVMDLLNQRHGATLRCGPGITPTRLLTHTDAVARVNKEQLDLLDGEAVTYRAKDSCGAGVSSDMINGMCRAKQVLHLKCGAQVILTKSLDQEKGLVNGARGVVVKIAGQTRLPVVRFSNGLELLIRRETWTLRRGEKALACRSQVPLELGWAISVHKSQGMTLDAVEMDLSSVFEYGQVHNETSRPCECHSSPYIVVARLFQAYVALSRARTLEGLRLTRRLARSSIRAHPDVVRFYRSAFD